jgi:Xaa-Pro dipeptidase
MPDQRLTRYLEQAGGEALLSAEPGLVRMLTGHAGDVATGPSPFQLPAMVLAPGDGPARLICSADEAAAGELVHTYEGFTAGPIDPPSGAWQALSEALSEALAMVAPGARAVLVDPATVPASVVWSLGERGAPAPDLLSLGSVKNDAELAAIEASVRLCDAGHVAARAATVAGATELDVWAGVTAAIERAAGRRVAMIADLVSGPRTAEVGGPPTDRRLDSGDLLICDLVPRLDGLWGDSCATWAVGEAPAWAEPLRAACLEALRVGLDALRPGALSGDVDALVRSVVAASGYEYPHHTGHGVGFRWHEQPRIVPGGSTRLEAGMVVALEPGGYSDGRGLRVEQVAVVTENGCRVLSAHPLGLAANDGAAA